MNALVSIEVSTLTPATVFAPGGVEGIISKLETEVRAIDRDISTPDGREAVKSLAYKVARSKTALDDMGKELVAGIKAQAATIDADRRMIRDRLDALKEEVRGPLTAWEDAEANRISGHENAICAIIATASLYPGEGSVSISEKIEKVKDIAARDWQEFHDRAHEAATDAITLLSVALATAEQAERDAAELAELRRMKAEREERDAQDARQRAINEQMQKAAEETAERERVRIEQQAERDRQQAEQAEREKIAAAARAVEQERERAARVKADEDRATAKREANKKHRAAIHRQIGAALVAHLFHDTPDAEGDELVSTIVDHIVAGRIPHVSIQY